MTREGPGISRGRAAVLLTTFVFLLSAARADAQPSFELTASSARAGAVVHFYLSEANGYVAYELEVEDQEVLEGTGDGVVSGTFTMPHLGDAVRTVTVEAELRRSDKQKKVKHKLEYLGSALPVTGPPHPATPPALPAALPPAAQAIQSPEAIEGTSFAPAVVPRSNRRPRKRRRQHAIEPPRHVVGSGERGRRARRGRNRTTRSKHPGARTAPLFDGIPEPGAGAHPENGGDIFALNAIAPRSAEVGATGALSGHASADAAVVVPALLGLAALTLAGVAVLRRRRLASRSGLD